MKDLFGNTEETMRALSWKRPYAGLMLPPFNKIETRTWNTKYRGLVLICASQKAYGIDSVLNISGEKQLCRIINMASELSKGYSKYGHAIAVGRLVNCRPMKKEDEDRCFVEYREPWIVTSAKTGKQRLVKLYCHEYENVRAIELIPFKGAQGWSEVCPGLVNKIKYLNMKNRCCGRCDGINDVCVSDIECESHNITGCEDCFGKRGFNQIIK